MENIICPTVNENIICPPVNENIICPPVNGKYHLSYSKWKISFVLQ